MTDVGKLYRDASMLAMRKRQVNRLQQENERLLALTEEQNGQLAILRGVLERNERLRGVRPSIRAATIEECAQELERNSYLRAAAIIRKLKDKP